MYSNCFTGNQLLFVLPSTSSGRWAQPHQPCWQVQFLFEILVPGPPLQSISPLRAHPYLHSAHYTLLLIIPIISVCSFGCSGEIIICLGINTLTGIFYFLFFLHFFIASCFLAFLFVFAQNAKRGWRSGHLGFSLTCCSLFVPLSLVF